MSETMKRRVLKTKACNRERGPRETGLRPMNYIKERISPRGLDARINRDQFDNLTMCIKSCKIKKFLIAIKLQQRK